MADLTFLEKQRFEKLFGMGSGYVLSFSDRTFQQFVFDATGRNIDDEKYKHAGGSKANRLRVFWSKESNRLVGKLLNELLQLLGEENPELRESEAYQHSTKVAGRLMGQASSQSSKGKATTQRKVSGIERNVFVVYGRDGVARREVFRFLRAIGLKPIDFSEAAVELTGKGSPYIGEVLSAAFGHAQAVLVIMTPDDEARLRAPLRSTDDEAFESQLTGQPRPNVIFEAGMALGLFPERTVLVELGKLRPISDLSGRHVIRLNNSNRAKQELARRLENAGCKVDLKGEWLDEGNFEKKAVTANAAESTDAIKKRIDEALEAPHPRWRTVERVAYSAGVTIDVATKLLQSDDRVRFSKGKDHRLIAGLRSRVDQK